MGWGLPLAGKFPVSIGYGSSGALFGSSLVFPVGSSLESLALLSSF